MPRLARRAPGGLIYHCLNRGNGRAKIFHKPGDYDAFVRILLDGLEQVPGMRVLGLCLMPNHWHLVLWPRGDEDLSRYVGWVSNTHVRRYHRHYASDVDGSGGHVYQGRFKSFPVQGAEYNLLRLLRYVEANAVRAKQVERPRQWRWGSFAMRQTGDVPGLLTPWPVDEPSDWEQLLLRPATEQELALVRLSVKRGRPLGDDDWVARMVKGLGLASTLRSRGRPKSPPAAAPQGKPGRG